MKKIGFTFLIFLAIHIGVYCQNLTQQKGLWINFNYLENIDSNLSITKTVKELDTYFSIQIDNNLDMFGLNSNLMEPDHLNFISSDSIKGYLLGKVYLLKIISSDTIYLIDEENAFKFIKLNENLYKNTFKAIEFLNSHIFFGKYQFINENSGETSEIEFSKANKIIGEIKYTNYYPSSYLGQDIIILRNTKREQQSFIFKATDSGFELIEIENFEWNSESLKKTGKVYKLKNLQ